MQFAVEHSEEFPTDRMRDLWFKPDENGHVGALNLIMTFYAHRIGNTLDVGK